MAPKEISSIVEALNLVHGLPKSQAFEHLKGLKLTNKGVEDLFRSQKDTDGVVQKLMEMSDNGIKEINPMDKFSFWNKAFTQVMDPKFLTEKAAPGIAGFAQLGEMNRHPEETFGDKTYQELTKSFERPDQFINEDKENVFQGQTVEKAGPYGISRWKESSSNRRKVLSQTAIDEIKQVIPKQTMAGILNMLQQPEFLRLSQVQKQNTVNKLLSDLQKDLIPLQKKLLEMGVDYRQD